MGSFQYGALVEQVSVIATAAGTTTLTNTSKQNEIFTGSAIQTIVLPDATTMTVGQNFNIFNQSTGVLTLEFNGGAAFTDASGKNYNLISANTSLEITLQTNGTTAGTWAVIASSSAGSGKAPTVQGFNSTGTQTGWLFTVSSWVGTIVAGDTYTNNGHTYTAQAATQTNGTGQTLWMSGTGATSGSTLTLGTSARGPATITFSAKVATATYTTPTGPAPLYLELLAVGGGAGGYNNGLGGSATAGGTTGFGADLITLGGGQVGDGFSNGGAGGTAALNGILTVLAVNGGGGGGGGGNDPALDISPSAGTGGNSILGGGGLSTNNNGSGGGNGAGFSGGGGGACSQNGGNGGTGGGAGAGAKGIITSPAATYPYVVGAGGAGGTGCGGGGSGYLLVWEYYQ